MIDKKLIFETRAEIKKKTRGETVISEGDVSKYFHYLLNGELSVYNFTEDGKEFLQHKVQPEHFFGEPATLLEKPFPGNVEVASESAEILKISRENFLEFMLGNPDYLLEFTKSVAEKSLLKTLSLKNIVFHNPEERIHKVLLDYKKEHCKDSEKVLVKITRKELSSMIGLRIETIIRTVKKMERDGKLSIKSGKIYI